MRVPLSWLRAYADLPDVSAAHIADALTAVGLKVEAVEQVGGDLKGVVVAEVLEIEELSGYKKPIRYVRVSSGEDERSVICGATNFSVGDRVALALPGAQLPGVPFTIEAKPAYGRMSAGMITSARELGLGDDHTGILVLDRSLPLGVDAVDALALRDVVFDIEVTPDRGYCLSVRGVAREAASAFDCFYRDPAARPDRPKATGGSAYDVFVDDVLGCDRYVARLVTDVDPAAPTPVELRRRLLLCGMRPVSLAVDVTNIVLLELGQPLHAFDRDRLSGPIVVRRARGRERLTTLDGVARTLEPADLVIADDSGAIALAGVMGGESTEVSAGSGALLIEAAHFAPGVVASTARRHKLSTEASRRFERGVDDELAPVAADAALRLLADLGGARAVAETTDVDNREARPSIELALELPGRLAGRVFEPIEVTNRLTELGCRVEGGDPVTVTPPSWRPDLRIPEDLVEEVVRLSGYDTIPSTLPAAPAGRGLTRAQRLRRVAAAAVTAAGYVEAPSYPFLSMATLDALRLPADDPRRLTVTITNPLDVDKRHLRTTLLPGLLETLQRNVSRGERDVSLFEMGLVFLPKAGGGRAPQLPGGRRPAPEDLAALDSALPDQPLRLGVVMSGDRELAGWWGPGRAAKWADAVAAATEVARALRVDVSVRQAAYPPWHPGRCAELCIGDRVIGHAGQLHPGAVEGLELPEPTCAMELDLDSLLAAAPDVVAAPIVSTFPVATLDLALVVDAGVPVAEVAAAVRDGCGELLESLRLFDVYTGPQIGDGRKSLAFSLRLRAPDRTLTAAEATGARDAAVAEAARRVGAELRGV